MSYSSSQTQIDKIKLSIIDKQVIFGKLKAEIIRMLRVFQKLQTMATTAVEDTDEVEQTVMVLRVLDRLSNY